MISGVPNAVIRIRARVGQQLAQRRRAATGRSCRAAARSSTTTSNGSAVVVTLRSADCASAACSTSNPRSESDSATDHRINGSSSTTRTWRGNFSAAREIFPLSIARSFGGFLAEKIVHAACDVFMPAGHQESRHALIASPVFRSRRSNAWLACLVLKHRLPDFAGRLCEEPWWHSRTFWSRRISANRRAWRWPTAATWRAHYNARLHVLHVVEDIMIRYSSEVGFALPDLQEDLEKPLRAATSTR